MKKQRWIRVMAIVMGTMLLLPVLFGCRSSGQSADETGGTADTAVIATDLLTVEYKAADLDDSWDAARAVSIVCNGTSVQVGGSGAKADGADVTINAAGTYVLSGTLDDGQITVNAGQNDKVRLVLNGVTLACGDSAPIYCKQADKLILILAAGTQNTVTDAAEYVYAGTEDTEPNAAIFSKSDLSITGTGSLRVVGNYNNGIGTKDDLVITNGNITVEAKDDGLRGRDCVAICGGTIQITAGKDGIKSNHDEDTAKGWVSIDGGTLQISAENDGIQAETVLQVTDGTISLNTGGGSANASTDAHGNAVPGWGMWGRRSAQGDAAAAADEDTYTSAKGLKAASAVFITGGAVAVDSSDDAVHSNGNVTVTGGTLQLTSGDDGMHADADMAITGGKIHITKSYEGIEGANITVSGGEVQVTASDDGLNAAGGDGSSQNGRPGANNFSAQADYYMKVTGGTLYVNASGDGIDANGSIYIEGGTVLVSGPSNDGNGALDYDGECKVTGGVLVAAGSSGMVQSISGSSTQAGLMVSYSSAQAAGTALNLTAADGTSIVSFVPAKAYSTVVISTSALEDGKTYTLNTGGSLRGDSSFGVYSTGYTGGSQVADITLSGTVTSVSDSGQAVNAGNGTGAPGRGGMR